MAHYHYQCTLCDTIYDRGQIEDNRQYLCPGCGASPENQPLRGVLRVVYNYHELQKQISRDKILSLPAGQPWLYPEFWPLDFLPSGELKGISPGLLGRLMLPGGLISDVTINDHQLFVMDETRNPTLSFKDRASVLVALKATQMGIRDISVASTGNAGSSMAGICARAGLKCHVWVPENIPVAKLLQIILYGAEVHLVKGTYDDAFDVSMMIASNQEWYNRNTAFNPLTIEGKKSAAWDMFISLQGKLPETIIIPVGDGVIISGVHKGFRELLDLGWIEKMPRLIAAQAKGSDALVRYLDTDTFVFRKAHTIADSLSAGAPRNLYMAAQALKDTGGLALAVRDEAIIRAQQVIARETGIFTEPAAAICFAGYEKLLSEEKIKPAEKVLLLLTGNGLKDTEILKKQISFPEAHSSGDWLEQFSMDPV